MRCLILGVLLAPVFSGCTDAVPNLLKHDDCSYEETDQAETNPPFYWRALRCHDLRGSGTANLVFEYCPYHPDFFLVSFHPYGALRVRAYEAGSVVHDETLAPATAVEDRVSFSLDDNKPVTIRLDLLPHNGRPFEGRFNATLACS